MIVIMGVAGAGKTTVGSLLAARLGFAFVDADDFHSVKNAEKMRAGIPLDPEDRAPWIQALSAAIDNWLAMGQDVVLACSALRALDRRALLRGDATPLVYLRVSPALAVHRLAARTGHFVGPALAASQFQTLDEPDRAVVIDASCSPGEAVARATRALGFDD